MTDKLCTPENCRLIGEWIGVGPEFCDQVSMQRNAAIPELIREALAKEGFDVCQRPFLTNSEIAIYSASTENLWVVVKWDKKNDPTARHALFAATVEYLEGKK